MHKTTLICGFVATSFLLPVLAMGQEQYAVTNSLKLGGTGGWDYVTVDAENKLLYLPRTTHTMVVQENDGKLIADIPGIKRGHGVALVPQVGRGFISDGEDGSVLIFDLKTHEVLGKVAAADDADGIIFDPSSNRILVACGDAGVLVPIRPDVDPKNGKSDEPIKLYGKPEFLASDGTGRVYVNIEDKATVAVIDTHQMKVTSRWSTAPGTNPTAMALDPASGNLFIGCRNQHLIVMSARDGHVVADLNIGKGVDACAFDSATKTVFASCGDGTLSIIRQNPEGAYSVIQKLQTRPGARTMGLDPLSHIAYLPTAEPEEKNAGRRPTYKPDTFMVLVVTPEKR